MNCIKLQSCVADQIQRFIELRRLSGMDYHSQGKLLKFFDSFLVKQGWNEPRIAREIIESYQKELERLMPYAEHPTEPPRCSQAVLRVSVQNRSTQLRTRTSGWNPVLSCLSAIYIHT
jgi:hypothetical protein